MRFIRVSGNGSTNSSGSATPLELLLGCHARTRHFMQLSRTLAGAESAPYPEIAQAATSILRHFSDTVPLHEADENGSLFSRLHAALPHGGLVREAAETMVEQHKAIHELVTELLPLCASLGRQPGRLPSVSGSPRSCHPRPRSDLRRPPSAGGDRGISRHHGMALSRANQGDVPRDARAPPPRAPYHSSGPVKAARQSRALARVS